MKLLHTILDWIFPNYCISCRSPGEYLCRDCLSDLPRADISEHNFITSFFNYRNKTMRDAIWLLKYRRRMGIAKVLAEAVYENFLEDLNDLETFDNFINPILIPIPLSSKRLKERKFNQAEAVAKELAACHTDWQVLNNVLYKKLETPPQARIKNRKERLENVKGCFEIRNKDLIKNRNIILIDDVTTTGATLSEAKKVLEKSGARKIIALTVAH